MAKSTIQQIRTELRKSRDKEKAAFLPRFFKTGPGEYGEGDKFIGVTVPIVRRLAKKHELSAPSLKTLLRSPYHEDRQLALFMLVRKYQTGDDETKKKIYELYLDHTQYVNNWDLVDGSAHLIVGDYLKERSRRPLYKLAKSQSLWERRIAIIATYCYIKNDDFEDTLAIAERLLNDKEDLIHKAVGWMLREVGNRDRREEERFLKRRYKTMPRTMLRYAIEKFPETKRQKYLKGKVLST